MVSSCSKEVAGNAAVWAGPRPESAVLARVWCFRGQPRRTTTHQQSTILLAIAVATAAATLPPPPQPPRRLRHVHGHRRLRLTPPLREKASCLFGLTSPFNREPT